MTALDQLIQKLLGAGLTVGKLIGGKFRFESLGQHGYHEMAGTITGVTTGDKKRETIVLEISNTMFYDSTILYLQPTGDGDAKLFTEERGQIEGVLKIFPA